MNYLFPRIAALALVVLLSACDYAIMKAPLDPGTGGSGSGGSTKSSIAINPSALRLRVSQSQQFVATVTGLNDTTVTWSLYSGDGTLTPTGLYTAPAAIPIDSVTMVVKATANGDTTLAALATIIVVRDTSTTGGGGNGGGGGGGNGTDTLVCFERDILPIFQSNCATTDGCHTRDSRADGYDLTSYAGIRAGIRPGRPGNSDIYEAITEDKSDERMPLGMPPLPQDKISLIRRWIMEGANETKCADNTGGNCDTSNITYSAVVSKIMADRCTGCHRPPLASKNVDLTTHAGVRAIALDGRLYRTISHAPGIAAMPYEGTKLTDCQILQIKAWIDRGAANN